MSLPSLPGDVLIFFVFSFCVGSYGSWFDEELPEVILIYLRHNFCVLEGWFKMVLSMEINKYRW